jgi:secreted PhoX family phosphatase
MLNRRLFLKGAGTLAFSGLLSSTLLRAKEHAQRNLTIGYGPLQSDSKKLLDLPKGFKYQVISSFHDAMSDGFHVPDRADGMGCIALPEGKVALIRNHELKPNHLLSQPESLQKLKSSLAYDTSADGIALPGGTSTIVYNMATQQVERQYLSLIGTIRNCSGGITPWGSWLSCEESVATADANTQHDHGYIFEVPANGNGLTQAIPLKEMGRFNHEAACVDPETGIVYLTEDRGDSLFYRFIPNVYGKLSKGGKLQALSIKGMPKFDSRNWNKSDMTVNQWFDAEWITLDEPESPKDDLRKRGHELGATIFARGEGIYWADNELYFTCTNGGEKQLGQIMRYQPKTAKASIEHQGGRIQLFLESVDANQYNFGDNLTVTPQGHLLVCEDQYTEVVENHLRGVTPQGEVYSFAKLNIQTELAGACFSPCGSTLFVNVYSPSKTLAITGPWNTV